MADHIPLLASSPTMAHILVIDDEPDVRDYLTSAFAFHNHQVTEAENGADGLIAARQIWPDLIVLDLNMPVMSGLDMLDTIKQDPALRDIPVIILTAQIDRAQIVECLDKGANDYITKPFGLQELLARASVQLRIQTLEHRLRESEAYHRALFELTSDPTLVIDQVGCVLQINEAATQLLSRSEVVHQRIADLVCQADRKKFEIAFSGALDGSDIPIFEIHLDTPDGRLLPVDVDMASVDIQNQRQILLHLRDIRRRKSAETQSSMILRHIGDAIFITDQTGTIIMTSHSAGQLTGYPAEELIGIDIAKFQNAIPRPLSPGEAPVICEDTLKRQTGELLPVEWTQAVFDVAGEIFCIGVARNLTDRQQAENQRLEAERLQALLETAGGTAHEINQPLTAIFGYAGMTQEALSETHQIQEYQSRIIQAAERISNIIKQMQTIRRYESRPYPHSHNIVDFKQSSQKDADEASE